ncbi:polyketide cyclase/dehydrase/lipid transport protein [Mumia flava]|uniref:Polyketide cyclase/dehydrase/lipid transport protein n=1 Tax=Mumia flava TaxID=1348852 RepID=A0A0B2AXY4_9ACTN|nr:SRPBCC family protein [Mumia flava]PJJ56060.1 polyketide cyclase/dehydrase/lipid transport protein [Mumia flava]
MTNQTTSDIVIDASPSQIMSVIADFDSYPEWATGVKQCDVVEPGPDGRATKVAFVLDASPIRDSYTLAYTWAEDHVEWAIDEPGSMLKAMDGAYVVEELPDGSARVTYRLAVEVGIPLLGMLRRKAEKVIIDTALKGLKKRVESTSS